jgi:hypothetical protein
MYRQCRLPEEKLMQLINSHLAAKAHILPPNDSGYILLAAEVGRRGVFGRLNPARRQLLAYAKARCADLAKRADVLEATVFRAVLVAPGEGVKLIKSRAGAIHHARYDVVILIRTSTVEAARKLRSDPEYAALAAAVRENASYVMEVAACNAVRLGDVDHQRNDVFLFNYFYADDKTELLPVFQHTAGWFQAKTGLANSTVLQPLAGEVTDNGIINHASWPNFRTFLPSLIFRPSFRSFVLANFAANNIAAQPILYRRVGSQ